MDKYIRVYIEMQFEKAAFSTPEHPKALILLGLQAWVPTPILHPTYTSYTRDLTFPGNRAYMSLP